MGRYIVIQDWMLGLGIRGSELTAYALVWGFTQDGESWYMGSRQYTAKWLQVQCLDTVTDIFRRLVRKGLLRKKTGFDSEVIGGRYTWYQAISPSGDALQGGVAEFSGYRSGVKSATVAECGTGQYNIVENIEDNDSINPLTPFAENLPDEDCAKGEEPIKSKTPRGWRGRPKQLHPARARKTAPASPFEVLMETVREFGRPVSQELLNAWVMLCTQPKWKGKSTDALKMNARKLFKVPENEAVAMVQNSIAGNWQGLFPLDRNEREMLNARRGPDGKKEGYTTRTKRECMERIASRHGGVIPAGMYGPEEIRVFPAEVDEQMNADANDPLMIDRYDS